MQVGLARGAGRRRAAAAALRGMMPVGVAVLRAHLLLNSSHRSGAVAEVEYASVPQGATWFHLRPAAPPPPPAAKPDGLLHSLWQARTPPKPVGQLPQGVQQIPFGASCEFSAGCIHRSQHNYSFVVEAWSNRNDLGGPGAAPVLLGQSAGGLGRSVAVEGGCRGEAAGSRTYWRRRGQVQGFSGPGR